MTRAEVQKALDDYLRAAGLEAFADIDSLDILELFMDIEEEFGIAIPGDTPNRFESADAFIDAVLARYPGATLAK